MCIFCRSARALPCDVVAEPQTSTLQVESSDQIHSDDSFVLVFETRFFTVLFYIYIVYIYADRYEGRNTAIFYLSLLSFSFALSLFLSLSLFLFLSSLKFLFIIMHRMWRRVISLGWSRGENESIRINIRAFVWIIYLCIFYKRILWIIFIIWKYESFRL